MKYTDFFNLREYPFNLTPNLRFYYRSQSQRRALSYLSFGLSKGEGFVVITGDIGAGKTVFIDYFLSNLPKTSAVTATVASTQFEADDFLRMIASAFGLRLDSADKATIFRNLEAFLIDVQRRSLRAILVIDEAQGLPHSALEELRMLSNIYQQGRPLLQVFLVGQPEFRRKLAAQGLEQLRQRIVAIHHLAPLSPGVAGKVVGRLLDRLALAQPVQLLHHEVQVEGIGMIVVHLEALVERQVSLVAIVGVHVDKRRVQPEGRVDGPGHGGLSRPRAAHDGDDQRGMH